MNLVSALILFNILILIYQVLIEIFTALCRLTGISYEKAKFQVVSLLTGTGFTTSESESMILTKKRRKLAQSIMLFSYIFNISIVSVFVNVFVSTSETTIQEIKLGLLLTIWNIAFIVFLRKFISLKFLDSIFYSFNLYFFGISNLYINSLYLSIFVRKLAYLITFLKLISYFSKIFW